MSFWSSLALVRSAPPPVVTAAELGAFVRDLAATGMFVGGAPAVCQLKYGSRVDADEQTTDVVDWDDSGVIATMREYPWDRSETFSSLGSMADALAMDTGSVYRAFLSLGAVHQEVVAALTREPSRENADAMCLYEASFSVGPVLVAGLASDAEALVGWMALSIGGHGYCFPWRRREARERAERVSLVRRVAEVCAATWPVEPTSVSAAAVAGRRALGELWLYDDFDVPQQWLWFVSESG